MNDMIDILTLLEKLGFSSAAAMVASAFFFDVDTNSRFTDEISQGYLGQARRKKSSMAHWTMAQYASLM